MTDQLRGQRCCPSHSSWTELVQHLADDFHDVEVGEVLEILHRVWQAEEASGLADEDLLASGEIIARRRLMELPEQPGPNSRQRIR
jgi:hypothetical protein